MRRLIQMVTLIALSAVVAMAASPTGVAADHERDRIPLPRGFFPEGISIGPDGTFYVGSIPTGAIFSGDVRTGRGSLLVEPVEGRAAIGLKVRRGRLFVAGGPTGQAYVYDADSGEELATYQLTEQTAFVNDVVVTRRAAWFTDSFNLVLYRVPLRRSGAPGDEEDVEAVALGGDIRLRDV
jgi:outer membrane protein assembly factor BamB